VHERLVAELPQIASDARFQPRWIWTPLAETCRPDSVEWVTRFHLLQGKAGPVMVGQYKTIIPEGACSAVAGTLTCSWAPPRTTRMASFAVCDVAVAGGM
jgi:hypothetical protein